MAMRYVTPTHHGDDLLLHLGRQRHEAEEAGGVRLAALADGHGLAGRRCKHTASSVKKTDNVRTARVMAAAGAMVMGHARK